MPAAPSSKRAKPGRASWSWTPARLAWLTAGLAWLAVVLTIPGPGITIDEPLDVRPGRTYIQTLLKRGFGFFEPGTVEAVFRDNAEHPPLGRWLLGIASTLGQPYELFVMGGPDPLNLYMHAARLAPATCFALMVGLVTQSLAKRQGTAAGLAAGFALAVMPRVFAHAHLGALDTFITCFWILALLAAHRALAGERPVRGMVLAGAFWSLALLTKIHAWLLIPIVGVMALTRLGIRRGVAALVCWGITGFVLFFAGWPWLWYDPVGRLLRFLGTGVERATIQVTYFGQVYADRDVPWHYPWFYFAVSVPVGLHLLAAIGVHSAWKRRGEDRDRLAWVAVGAIVFLLMLFSTRVPVYDGDRLYLMAFPLWAWLVGVGFATVWERAGGRAWARGLAAVFLVAQGYGVVALHPFQLSYYNALVGGLAGAERLGLELTFWNDAVDRVLLDRLAAEAKPGQTAALLPTLYPGQGIATTNRALAAKELVLGDEDAAPRADWLVVSRRTAYWKPPAPELMARARRVAVRERQGVWLSAIFALDPPGSSPTVPPALPNNSAR